MSSKTKKPLSFRLGVSKPTVPPDIDADLQARLNSPAAQAFINGGAAAPVGLVATNPVLQSVPSPSPPSPGSAPAPFVRPQIIERRIRGPKSISVDQGLWAKAVEVGAQKGVGEFSRIVEVALTEWLERQGVDIKTI